MYVEDRQCHINHKKPVFVCVLVGTTSELDNQDGEFLRNVIQ